MSAPVRPRPAVAPATTATTSRVAGSWDPLIRPPAWALLVVALVLNCGALNGIPDTLIPNTVPLLVGLACIGAALILPRDRPVVVPLLSAVLVGLLILSVLWSRDPAASSLWLRSSGLVTLGIIALVLVLPTDETVKVILAFTRLTLLITIVAVIIEPKARIHIDPLGLSPNLKGWHGYFVHKNILAAFMVFGLAAVLSFDRSRWLKWLTVGTIGFFFVVSDSTTGRMAALVLVSVHLWFETNRRLSGRSSSALAVATVALLAVVGVAIGTSLTAIADAAGKDLTFTGRTKIWSATWRAVLRDPIVGHGVNGLFGTPRTSETAQVLQEIGFAAGHPHNGFLDVAVQLGAVGVVLVVTMIAVTFRSAARLQRRAPQFASFGLSVMSGIVIMSIGESVFLGSAVATIAAVRILLLRAATDQPRGVETSASRTGRLARA